MSWNGVKKQVNKVEIEAWCDEIGIENYIINSQGEIDVDGDVILDYRDFEELPYKFGTINGYFSLGGCKNLISLKNCPNYIMGNNMFDIDLCSQLDSLEGCPKEVGGSFFCRDCKRKFTKEEVESLCKVKGTITYTLQTHTKNKFYTIIYIIIKYIHSHFLLLLNNQKI